MRSQAQELHDGKKPQERPGTTQAEQVLFPLPSAHPASGNQVGDFLKLFFIAAVPL
jgi:hypothetical protein